MTTTRFLLLALLALVLAGCTPMVYGVREDVWMTMSEAERIQAIDAHKERQIAWQRASEERASRQRLELEQLRQQRLEDEARHHARIVSFYHGNHHYGDLLRVRLQGGVIRIGGKKTAYRPLVFTIAAGEIRRLTLYTNRGLEVALQVAYINGVLFLDGEPSSKNSSYARLSFNTAWGSGLIYTGLFTRNLIQLDDVELYVEVVDPRRHDLRRAKLPDIIIYKETRREHYDQKRAARQPPQRPQQPDYRPQQPDYRPQQPDYRPQQPGHHSKPAERQNSGQQPYTGQPVENTRPEVVPTRPAPLVKPLPGSAPTPQKAEAPVKKEKTPVDKGNKKEKGKEHPAKKTETITGDQDKTKNKDQTGLESDEPSEAQTDVENKKADDDNDRKGGNPAQRP